MNYQQLDENHKLYLDMVKKDGYSIRFIPEENLTEKIVKRAIRSEPLSILFVKRDDLFTKSMIRWARFYFMVKGSSPIPRPPGHIHCFCNECVKIKNVNNGLRLHQPTIIEERYHLGKVLSYW